MKSTQAGRLIILLLLAVLAACTPAAEPAPEGSDPTQSEASNDAAVPETQTDPAESEPAESDPEPGATIDRSIRLTPGALPRGAEMAPQTTPEPVVEPIPEELMVQTLVDLQNRLQLGALSAEDYTVIRAEAVTWPDGSLGCPEPGVMYTQALVDGYQLIIEANGEMYDYRLASNGFVKLCEGGLRP